VDLSHKPVVVIDTNVWVTGLIFGCKPELIIHLFIDGQINVVISEELVSELRRKINQRFPLYLKNINLLEAAVRDQALVVPLGLVEVNISRDKDDNVVIETAIAGGADYIITGDKDLLVLKKYKNIKILKPSEFLENI